MDGLILLERKAIQRLHMYRACQHIDRRDGNVAMVRHWRKLIYWTINSIRFLRSEIAA